MMISALLASGGILMRFGILLGDFSAGVFLLLRFSSFSNLLIVDLLLMCNGTHLLLDTSRKMTLLAEIFESVVLDLELYKSTIA